MTGPNAHLRAAEQSGVSTRQLLRRRILRALPLTAGLGLCLATGAALVRGQSAARVIPISMRKFAFTPELVTVKVGEPVIFRVTTADIAMGFSISEFKISVPVVPGKDTDIPFTAGKPGDFTFFCDVICGDGHEDMEGKLRVTA